MHMTETRHDNTGQDTAGGAAIAPARDTRLMRWYKDYPGRKMQLIRSIADETGVSFATAVAWMIGIRKTSDPARLAVLERVTGIPRDQMFDPVED